MIFFFSIVTVGSVVTLSGCTDCFREPDAPDLKVGSINNSLVYISNVLENSYGSTYFQVEDFTSATNIGTYDSIGLLIKIESFIAQIKKQTLNPFIINSAYACDVISENIDKIQSIEISSNEDYNELYKVGNNLNDLFVISMSFSTLTTPIPNYLENHYLGDYTELLIVPIEAPDFERTHIFTLEITLKDGRVFSQQFDPVTIKI